MTEPSNSPKNITPSRLSQALEKVQPTVQRAWVGTRPTIAQLLKGTIRTLQTAVDGLEHQIKADGSTVPPLDLTPVQTAANTFWTKTQPIWMKVIELVRSRLPQDVSHKLSDRGLSGILAGTMLLLLWITTSLPGGGSAPRSTLRPVPVAAAPRMTAPKPMDPIAKQFPIDGQPAGMALPRDLSAPGIAPQPPVTPPPVPQTPIAQTPIAQTPIAPITKTAPVIAPAPVKLTPQQKMLARIQSNLPDFGQGLAQAVSPDPAHGKLKMTLANNWYDLTSDQQDQLAAALFGQAQTLKFPALELIDGKDNLLARSPIVGNDMVILLR
jgi:hypothetical protein